MDDGQFFATAAQVIATLMVVAAIEVRRLDVDPRQGARGRRLFTATVGALFVVSVVGEATALVALKEPKGEWAKEVVQFAFATQMALLLTIAFRSISQVGRSDISPEPPPTAHDDRPLGLVWVIALWLLLRRPR